MELRCILVVLCVGVCFGSDPKECCDKGTLRGRQMITDSKITDCGNPPSELTLNDNIFSKLLCNGMFQSCCKIAASSQSCLIGVTMAMSNQECKAGADKGAGVQQKTCCECCKAGKLQAAKKDESCGNFTIDGGSDTCRASYKDCCKKTREATSPSLRTCSILQCNKATQNCVDAQGGAKCVCKKGFREFGDSCVDVNECVKKQYNCPTNSFCVNSQGGYSCSCVSGYDMVDEQCVKDSCGYGMVKVDGKCEDVDECATGIHRCPIDSYCRNVVGDYRCLTHCPAPSYQVIKHRTTTAAGICQDVNECAKNTSKCLKNYECVNTIGSYDCKRVSCDSGYLFVNGYCEDIDECANDPGICGPKGVCRNAFGSYYCDCYPGYSVDTASGASGKCADVDECKLNNNCKYKCNNTEGSYVCYCPYGYTMRNSYCYDNNECENNPCDAGEHCFNTYGGYKCIHEPCKNDLFQRTSYNQCRKKYCTGHQCDLESSSIKWQAFRMLRDSPPKWFQFIYTLTGFKPEYNFHFALVEGNDEHVFDIRRVGRGKVAVYNAKILRASQEFRLVMYADVRIGSKQYDRYEYIFYVYVSPYNF